ncbi:MAG: AMP-binding protein [Thermodesulfobacteriota bacterium]
MTVEDTLPKILRRNYRKYRDKKVAMRVKDEGIWRSYTWKDYYEKVKYFSLGLINLGLQRGDKVSILGENKPEWYWAELAVQSAGATVVGIFTDCTPQEVKYFVEHSDSRFVVVHDQEQVDKLLEIRNELPMLIKVIYWDTKGLWSYRDPILISFDEVVEIGCAEERYHPNLFDENIDKGSAGDIGVICYTSGTTGLPKGAMLSQKWLVGGVIEWSNMDGWANRGYEYLSFIPPAWVTEQALGISGSLLADVVVNFPEKPETVQEDLREIGPDILFYGARLWENVNRMVQARMIDSTFLRRFIYRLFLLLGYRVVDHQSNKGKVSLFGKILYLVAYHAVFRQLRDNLGLSNVKVVYSAGGAISPEIIRFFQALGIGIKLFYGGTELGLISAPRQGDIKPETSGTPVPWAEVMLSDEGEILVKSEYMYSGYYKDHKATEAKLRDGWYCTGDFGYLNDEGHLIVIDRMDDLKTLSSGKKFSPQYTEIRLRFSPYIKDVLVVGGKDNAYVGALIDIDIENVGRFAEAKHIPYTTFTDLSQKDQVIELVRGEIKKVNRTLPEWTRIKRFVNLHKEFDADEAELTRTRKLRRTFVEDRYGNLIAALYGEDKEYNVDALITYRDGRRGVIKTAIKVNSVDEVTG